MSLLSPRPGPPLGEVLAYLVGRNLVKRGGLPEPSYGMSGPLYLSKSGWLLLGVPNGLARSVLDALDEPGVELPPAEHGGAFNAHISVMSPQELEQLGGPDKVTERGKRFRYSLGRLMTVEPDDWPGVARVWYVHVHSDALQQLRQSYGLSPLPRGGEYAFHVTVGVRRRGVLGRNETSKES